MASFAITAHTVRCDLNTMLNFIVTMQAFDCMLGHVNPVQFLGLPKLLQTSRFIVTGKAAVPWDVSHAADHTRVAPIAFHVKPFHIGVRKRDACLLNKSFRDLMAGLAFGRSRSRGRILKMAKKTGRSRHRNMHALHNL
jgi:hypothetical protein